MATTLMSNHPDTGSNTAHWYYDLRYDIISQNAPANQTTVRFYIVVNSDNGAYTQTGSWVRQAWYPYSSNLFINSTSSPGTISNSPVTLNTADVTVTHDTNGNYSQAAGYYLNTPATEMFTKTATLTLPRLALAPTISSVMASNIAPTTATITTSISSNGHGTSTTVTTYYRVQGSGSWTSAGTGTVANLTGLIPGTTYQFYAYAVNNNGDPTDTSGSPGSFTTLPVSGMAPLLMGLLN